MLFVSLIHIGIWKFLSTRFYILNYCLQKFNVGADFLKSIKLRGTNLQQGCKPFLLNGFSSSKNLKVLREEAPNTEHHFVLCS
jgi:hypothetical protein